MRIIQYILILLIPLSATALNDTQIYKNEKTFHYAFNLYEKGDYYRAITEWKRYLFFNPSKNNTSKAEFYMGMCYLQGGDYQNALYSFQNIYKKTGHPYYELTTLKIADTYFYKEWQACRPVKHIDDHDYQEINFSEDYYRNYLNQYEYEGKYKEEASIKLITVNMLNLNKQRAISLLTRFTPEEEESKEKIAQLSTHLKKINDISQKSEVFATILSVLIPGAGQMYAGDFGDGLITLGVNGLFAYSAYYAYVYYSKLLGILIGYYELTFYMGNIRNAQLAVYKYNENEKYIYKQDLIKIAF